MYIELKGDGLRGDGRIGWVQFSKTGKTIYYRGRTLRPAGGIPLKANYFDEDTGEDFWVSGPRSDGCDSLFPTIVEVDDDARQDYWANLRNRPDNGHLASYRSPGKTKTERGAIEKALRRRQMDNGWLPEKN